VALLVILATSALALFTETRAAKKWLLVSWLIILALAKCVLLFPLLNYGGGTIASLMLLMLPFEALLLAPAYNRLVRATTLRHQFVRDLAPHSVIADVQFVDTTFDTSDFDGSELSNVVFVRCHFRNVRIPRSLFVSCRFENCHFEGCDLAQTQWQGCRFWQVSIVDSSLAGARITKTHSTQLTLVRTDLRHADLSAVSMREIHLDEVIQDGSTTWPYGFNPA
jgi:uncharacterized protein YjbI with pentapeptide repeats